jgi:hypothetical protein
MFGDAALINPAVSGEMADPDGDGMSNLAEFRAGTRPLDRTSALRFRALKKTAGVGFEVRWRSESNRSYTIERSTNLTQGFTSMTNGILSTPPENMHSDAVPPEAGAVFYRIRMD